MALAVAVAAGSVSDPRRVRIPGQRDLISSDGVIGSRGLHFVSDIDRKYGAVGAVVEGIPAFAIDLGDDVCAECFSGRRWVRHRDGGVDVVLSQHR
jgi:hypothetical protein